MLVTQFRSWLHILMSTFITKIKGKIDFIRKRIEKDKFVELYNEEIHVLCNWLTNHYQYHHLKLTLMLKLSLRTIR